MASNSKKDDKEMAWEVDSVISERLSLPPWATNNVIKMLDQGDTIPFIARYRKEKTGDMPVDSLREIYSMMEDLRSVESKINSVKAAIEKMGKMTAEIATALKHAQTLTEVDHLYAPYKPGNKGSLAERARALGLEPLAQAVLKSHGPVNMMAYIKPQQKGLATLKEVETGVQHILADIVHKDKTVMQFVRKACTDRGIILQSTQAKASKKKTDKLDTAKKTKSAEDNIRKFQQYLDYKIPVRYVKSHQVLAINRGEDNKVLSVKIVIPEKIKDDFCHLVWKLYHGNRMMESSQALFRKSIEDSYDRLIQPQMCRQIRTELTKKAEKDSIVVFASNLKHLLLTSPIKGKIILAVDPGFTNGCKCAIISPTGEIINTFVIFMHDYKADKRKEKSRLLDMINTYRCDVFAIGNGVACRETETFISDLIRDHRLAMQYCIINESGASIYSVSEMAQKELPDFDPTLRGAVSIGRRLLDPLSEFVKIEPKHIGVGMYQHDIAENKLKTSLDSVVEECVSFVGVDVNTGSQCVLRRIAGLSDIKAKNIIEWRRVNGPFICREQLLNVKGLGEKIYKQCAGFIRVLPSACHYNESSCTGGTKEEPAGLDEDSSVKQKAGQKRKSKQTTTKAKKKKKDDYLSNPLDVTWIHPESYTAASSLMEIIGVEVAEIGQKNFINQVEKFVRTNDQNSLAEKLGIGLPTLSLIVDAFTRPINYDIRGEFAKPLFKKGLCSMEELNVGTVLTGRVENVTHFGAFVDIGVGTSGLIHTSKMNPRYMNGKSSLDLGDKVEAKVVNVEISRKRIGLELMKIL